MVANKTSKKRQDIVDTAMRLFNQYGYVSVGVDRIIAESGVAKMTFYKFFPSKDDLIKETLITRDQLIREGINKAISQISKKEQTTTPHVDALFNWYDNWLNSDTFHGCMFIKASDEFGDNKELNGIIREHKDWLNQKIYEILEKDNAKASDNLAAQIGFLLDGAIINKSIYKDSDAIRNSHSLVHQIINA